MSNRIVVRGLVGWGSYVNLVWKRLMTMLIGPLDLLASTEWFRGNMETMDIFLYLYSQIFHASNY